MTELNQNTVTETPDSLSTDTEKVSVEETVVDQVLESKQNPAEAVLSAEEPSENSGEKGLSSNSEETTESLSGNDAITDSESLNESSEETEKLATPAITFKAPVFREPVSGAGTIETYQAKKLIDGSLLRTTPEPPKPEKPKESNLAISARTRDSIAFIDTFCVRKCDMECNRCELICPVDAITINETNNLPSINTDLCTKCGLCAGVCDGFATSRISYEDLLERIDRISDQFGEVFVTCSDHIFPEFEPQESVLVLPCLAALPPEGWTYLLSCGKPVHVYIDESYCDNCKATNSTGKRLYEYITAVAQQWSNVGLTYVDEIPETGNLLGKYRHGINNYDRRALFFSSAREAVDIASGDYRTRNESSTNEFIENRERMRASGYINQKGLVLTPGEYELNKPINSPRLTALVRALEKNPEMASRIEHYYLETDNDLCDGCGKCVEACPLNARSISEETAKAVTNHFFCSSCSVCIEACPKEACFYIEDDAKQLLPKED